MSVEKKRAQTVLIIEWVLFAITIILVSILTVVFSKEIADAFNNSKPYQDNTFLALIAILVIVSVLISLFMNVLLTAGIKKNNSTACKTWYIISIIFIAIYILDIALAIISLNVLGVVIKGCVLWYRYYAVKTIMALTRVLEDPTLATTTGGVVYSATPVGPGQVNDVPPPYPSAVFQKV